ncbi:hypothetical protein [Plantactinospora sp. B24E8]|uniref:hypothetical protein n=1 Tax=Plantactinospora sp. B24E8 TaxID=3153567 RepID=UPI00325CEE6E
MRVFARRRGVVLAAAVLMGVAGLPVATPAAAAPPPLEWEWNDAVQVGGFPGAPDLLCSQIDYGTACFLPYGDQFYVQDGLADGASVVAEWRVYVDGSVYRRGRCRISLGAGKVGVCNKDLPENREMEIRVRRYDGDTGLFVSPDGVWWHGSTS